METYPYLECFIYSLSLSPPSSHHQEQTSKLLIFVLHTSPHSTFPVIRSEYQTLDFGTGFILAQFIPPSEYPTPIFFVMRLLSIITLLGLAMSASAIAVKKPCPTKTTPPPACIAVGDVCIPQPSTVCCGGSVCTLSGLSYRCVQPIPS